MRIERSLILACSATICLLSACKTFQTTPALDQSHGQALAALKAQQTFNPAAALQNGDRSVGSVEASAVTPAVDRYYKSFAVPPPPVNIINIGVGTSGK